VKYQLVSDSDVVECGSEMPVFIADSKGWHFGTTVLSDSDIRYRMVAIEEVVEAAPPKVGPIHFQMLFTAAEGEKADELRATNKTLARFWKLVDDPRADVVDLSLQSVQNAVEYTLAAVKEAGVEVDVPTRKAEILTGVLR